MKHLEIYAHEIAERLKKVKGIRKLRTLVDARALFFSFSMRDLSVFNEIDKVIPPNYYISIKQNKAIIEYYISEEFNNLILKHFSNETTYAFQTT